jgi:hypothetical protein
MIALYAAVRQVWGLFVEDASLTVGILLWVVLASFLLPRTGLRPSWRGPAMILLHLVDLLEIVSRRFQNGQVLSHGNGYYLPARPCA